MADDDIKRMVKRIVTAEVTVINEIRALGDRLDGRDGRIEQRLTDLEGETRD